MRRQGLQGRAKGCFRVCTTDSHHDQPIAPNRLPNLPAPRAPNQVWLGDITYVATEEGWLYLAGIMDLYSRRLTGWTMSERINTESILAAWGMALTHRQPPAGLVFPSDRGVEYASHDYRQALQNAQALASMSRKGNCYDNAAMESFWSTFKQELIYRRHFQTREEARQAIFDFIEVFYNRRRLHSSLGYRSPIDFETQNGNRKSRKMDFCHFPIGTRYQPIHSAQNGRKGFYGFYVRITHGHGGEGGESSGKN